MTQTTQSPVVVCDREAYQRLLCLRFPWNERPDPRGWVMTNIVGIVFGEQETVAISEQDLDRTAESVILLQGKGKEARHMVKAALSCGADIDDFAFVCEVLDDKEHLGSISRGVLKKFDDHMEAFLSSEDYGEMNYSILSRFAISSALREFGEDFERQEHTDTVLEKFGLGSS